MIHDFQSNLAYSLDANTGFDLAILKNKIDGCVDVQKTDVETDKTGVDYVATLRRGATINIDGKTRKQGASRYWRYGEPELALEIYSVVPSEYNQGKIGWTLNESSPVDLILFTFDSSDSNMFYLLPFQHLRMAFRRNGRYWAKKYGIKTEYSNSWRSQAIFVPASVVISALSIEMVGCADIGEKGA